MKRPKDKLFAGLDLHSNNVMIGVINQDGQRLTHRKLECDIKAVIEFLEPLKPQLQSMAVESTFNWYWLVDGLRQQGYWIDLANPAQIEQYNGIKHADDKDDAFYLAELQRLNILPKGYVYDPQLRPVRDLLRRRITLVHHRTALLLSIAGVGKILGMTITMEVGEIQRFRTDGDFASYCRLVDARRFSNGKAKGQNNRKCGNKYLAWAFVEAANFARRYDPRCRRWYDRKAAKTCKVLATKALACKRAKAQVRIGSCRCKKAARKNGFKKIGQATFFSLI